MGELESRVILEILSTFKVVYCNIELCLVFVGIGELDLVEGIELIGWYVRDCYK